MLVKRWRRKVPTDRVEYFLVWESTKAGWPHAHVLLAAPRVSKHWLSTQWRELTGSYIIDLQNVSSAQHAAGYLTKYLAKNPAVPAGQRRYRRSAAFFQTADEPPTLKLPILGKWQREPFNDLTLCYQWVSEGLFVQQMPNGTLNAYADPHRRQVLMSSQFWENVVRHVALTRPGLLRYEHASALNLDSLPDLNTDFA
jgi:hypothetical protein